MTGRPTPRRVIDVQALVVGIVHAVVFVAAITTIIVAQQTTGWPQLLTMLGALAVLIAQLAIFNRRHR
ncbi:MULTISPECIES: DUF6903 family protein [Microbacterium]|jgi:uncharacterized membrane protein YhaH (DUF805 family)|uniref:Uncharacterized protein n=1 Tax=Microbacterium galbinum TaxID=2851646 RepID=A0ABY4IQK4_9MICO|nr:hypothetical protein [Microbacterium galbinum]UPL13910.1 hypothetical protein KV396_05210 [Microbacterium galbinum]